MDNPFFVYRIESDFEAKVQRAFDDMIVRAAAAPGAAVCSPPLPA